VASRHCRNEVQYALEQGKLVVSVHLQPTELPGGLKLSLGGSQAIMMSDLANEDYRRKLSDALQFTARSDDHTAPAGVTLLRRWGGTATLIGVLVIGVAYFKGNEITVWAAQAAMRIMAKPVSQNIAFTQSSDGVRIAYATSGSGTPLVFVNGFATHLTDGWASPIYDIAGYLRWYARDYLTVHYDGRGFGLSDRDVSDFSLDARVADLEAVVDAVGAERAVIYGFSSGARVAIAYAVRHPERVSHLVLTGANVATPSTAEDRARMIDLFKYLASNWQDRSARATIAEFIAPDSSRIERSVLIKFFETAGEGPAISGFLSAQMDLDVSDLAQEISVPTLIVAADGDPVVPFETTSHLASLVPRARFEILEGVTSHAQASTDDPRLMQMVSEFLATHQ